MQDQAANHLELLWSRARVVSVEEKGTGNVSGENRKDERKRTVDEASKIEGDVKTGICWLPREERWSDLLTANVASGE